MAGNNGGFTVGAQTGQAAFGMDRDMVAAVMNGAYGVIGAREREIYADESGALNEGYTTADVVQLTQLKLAFVEAGLRREMADKLGGQAVALSGREQMAVSDLLKKGRP